MYVDLYIDYQNNIFIIYKQSNSNKENNTHHIMKTYSPKIITTFLFVFYFCFLNIL